MMLGMGDMDVAGEVPAQTRRRSWVFVPSRLDRQRWLLVAVVAIVLVGAGGILAYRSASETGRNVELTLYGGTDDGAASARANDQCSWDVQIDGQYWMPRSVPPSEWGNGPVSGRIEVVATGSADPGSGQAVFRARGRSLQLWGPFDHYLGCAVGG